MPNDTSGRDAPASGDTKPRKPRWKQSGGAKGRRASGKAGKGDAVAVTKAARRLKRRTGRQDAGPGVPKAVERGAGGKPAIQTPARLATDTNARLTWLLDLLAWAGHGEVAKRIDLRGSSAPMPPVILPQVGTDELVALDTVDAIRRLRSRHRAFSQMAGRYSAMVLAARDTGRRLRLELWDLDDAGDLRPADESLVRLWPQLASYLDGEVWVADAAALQTRLDFAKTTALPARLQSRNPVAWGLSLACPGAAVSQAAVEPAETTETTETTAS